VITRKDLVEVLGRLPVEKMVEAHALAMQRQRLLFTRKTSGKSLSVYSEADEDDAEGEQKAAQQQQQRAAQMDRNEQRRSVLLFAGSPVVPAAQPSEVFNPGVLDCVLTRLGKCRR
jgi:hypothetical protein